MSKIKFSFNILAKDGNARCGEIYTPRGIIRTPAFMPVGTAGTVKFIHMDQVKELGSDVFLCNTYHLMLRPGGELISALGGLHKFTGWKPPILTDSGGFQVMSLAQLCKITEDGVTFKSHIDGSRHHLTPERSIEIQNLLDSDIQMQLDECVALPSPPNKIVKAMELSLKWAERCVVAFGNQPGKAMFGIVQGGDNEKLRLKSARILTQMDLKGYAIGGLAVGEPQKKMLEIVNYTCLSLPMEKPRYLMGVGTPDDIIKSVAHGVDMFDCVMPTRAGRHGLAFTKFGRVNLRNACHKNDSRPLDEKSNCHASRSYSRAYLHHLVRSNESLGAMLLTWNNLAYYQDLMGKIRESIRIGSYADFMAKTIEDWNRETQVFS